MKRVLLILAVVTLGVPLARPRNPRLKSLLSRESSNFAQVETTVACAGAVKPGAGGPDQEHGFRVHHQPAAAHTNKGAERIDAEAAEAKAAGITFIHIPFNGSMPDPAVAESLLFSRQSRNQAFSRHSFIAPVETARRRDVMAYQTRADPTSGTPTARWRKRRSSRND